MLGSAVNRPATPSDLLHRPSSHPTHLAHLETASSSSSNTPISSTAAPPSTSAVGSARLPAYSPSSPHDELPAYIRAQSHAFPQQSLQTSSATPPSAHRAPPSMPSTVNDAASNPFNIMPGIPSTTVEGPRMQNDRSPSIQAPSIGGASSHEGSQSSPPSPRLRPTFRSFRSLGGSEATSPSRIKVRDLSHIQSFASEEFLTQSQGPVTPGLWLQDRQYEISSMPVTDIIEMVAGLLTKITSTNDAHHELIHRQIPPVDGVSLSPQATSVLAFHGKNVPSISIHSYLARIHKYCPTTYEVFLSLLVYFDRMTEIVNKGHLDRLRRHYVQSAVTQHDYTTGTPSMRPPSDPYGPQHAHSAAMVTPPSSGRMTAMDTKTPLTTHIAPPLYLDDEESSSHFFVIDSFNIHRLVIAGVTCASKFFSDVFYTNSRYAKVGGLPLVELNHLELQFLLLNDFRLAIPVEELEAYGSMLVAFYARQIVAQQQQQQAHVPLDPMNPPVHPESQPDVIYMRPR